MLISRILDPVSKLATARALSPATASSSLGEALGLGEVDDDELYAALDWLLVRQPAIETASGQTPSQERHARALRCLVKLHGGALLSAGQARLQP